IEEAVSLVPGVTRVRSKSIRGATEINMTFIPTTDMVIALQQVQARVNEVRRDLPVDLEIQIERMTPSLFPILSYNLEGGDASTLYDIARYQIRPVLSRISGVARVEVQGSDVREIEVVADPARLAAQGLSYEDLAAAIKASTTVDAVGRLPQNYKQYLIVTAVEPHSAEDIASIVVARGLRVRDLANVSPGIEDHVRVISADGRPAASIFITRQVGGNTLAIARAADSVAQSIRANLPQGVRLNPLYDQATLVKDAMTSVRDAMLIGALLAVIVLLVFLRHARITAISASSIPLTLSITVFVMYLAGQSFNLMTLGAMAIAIGLVIDDAVVITENIVRHLKLNADRSAAIREAVQELIWPVTTSTITTVVVFLPLGLLQGVVGQFFRALSITLTIAVLISLVLALTIIPLMSEQYLGDSETDGERNESGRLARLGEVIDRLSVRTSDTLGTALNHPGRIGIVAVLLVAAGILAYRAVGTGFLPEMDEGAFVLDYVSPGGTAIDETDRMMKIVERTLAQTPEIVGTSRRTGAELGLFATAQNSGDLVARLKRPSERDRSTFEVIDDVRAQLEKSLPRLRIEFVQILADVIGDVEGIARPVELRLFGPDLGALEAYAERLTPGMEKVAGMEDFYNGVSEPSAEMLMHLNEAEINRAGLTPVQVAGAVSGALLGVTAGEVRLDDRAINVRVRAPDSVRFSGQRLTSLPVVTPSGSAVPLGTLASFEPVDARAELLRENQQQMIEMTAGVSGRALGDVMKEVRAVLGANPPPAGVRVEVGGADLSQRQAFAALLLVLGLATASVVAVMVLQFQSFVEPFAVLLAAPLSFVGAMAMLLLTGTPLNVSSFMGLILLVGLIVKNGIILLDFTRHQMRESGLALEPALREAARIRLRPILMTTLCTVFGLFPLALGIGAGAELQRPLALAVIGGLVLSTPVTLFVVPTLLVAIRGRGYRLPPRTDAT
ncbi:MAG: efflux RND transporter permease subunit, partial [Gemmatimonadaceae bacterium]